jgi:hypothetical protein
MGAGYEPKDREQAKPRTGGGLAPPGKGRGWLDLSGGIADQDRAVTPGPDGMPIQLRPQAQDGEAEVTQSILANSAVERALVRRADIQGTVDSLELLLDDVLKSDASDKQAKARFGAARKAHVDAQAFGIVDALSAVVDLAQAFKGVASGLHGLMTSLKASDQKAVPKYLRIGGQAGHAIDVAGGYKASLETVNRVDRSPDTVTAMVDALHAKIESTGARLAAVEQGVFQVALQRLVSNARFLGIEVREASELFARIRPGSPVHHKVLRRMPDLAAAAVQTSNLLSTKGTGLLAIFKARQQGDVSALVRGSSGRKAIDTLLSSDQERLMLYVFRRREVDARTMPPEEADRGFEYVLAGLSPELHRELQELAAPDADRLLKHAEPFEGLPLREDVGLALQQVPTIKKAISGSLLARIQGKVTTRTVPIAEWESRRDALTLEVNDDPGERSALKAH